LFLVHSVASSVSNLLAAVFDPDITAFAPAGTPGVFNFPGANAGTAFVVIPTANGDGMVYRSGSIPGEAATGISLHIRIAINSGSYCAVIINLLLNGGGGRYA
jgi:hypothetical protein